MFLFMALTLLSASIAKPLSVTPKGRKTKRDFYQCAFLVKVRNILTSVDGHYWASCCGGNNSVAPSPASANRLAPTKVRIGVSSPKFIWA